jgi:hypothetical protein
MARQTIGSADVSTGRYGTSASYLPQLAEARHSKVNMTHLDADPTPGRSSMFAGWPSPGAQLVGGQLLDSLDVAGAAAESTGDLGMIAAPGEPFQDPALHRPQRPRFRRGASPRQPGVNDHSPHELGATTEPTGDLGVIDTVANEAEDTAFERP